MKVEYMGVRREKNVTRVSRQIEKEKNGDHPGEGETSIVKGQGVQGRGTKGMSRGLGGKI